MTEQNRTIIKIFSEICIRIIYSSLGESAGGAILFLLHKDLGRDPFEVFWEDPKTFYHTIEKIFGAGTKVLINLLIAGINRESGLNINPEHFLELMRSGDQSSVEEIRSSLKRAAELRGGEDMGVR